MTKQDIKTVVDEYRDNKYYPNVSTEPLVGCALPDFPKGKYVRKEAIVNLLRWQCKYLNGETDEEELTNVISILKIKRVHMI